MARYQIGNITFIVSPVSIMQCWVGIGWQARGSADEIREYRSFTRQFFPFLIEEECEQPIGQFCTKAVDKMDQIIAREQMKTDLLTRFARRIRGRLNSDNQRRVTSYSEEYEQKVQQWLDSPIGRCSPRAVSLLAEWELEPPYPALAAIGAFGNAVFGQYVPSLQAVCVQLDVIDQSENPELEFLETLLHEQIHAAIHKKMGDDDERPELAWLNELCAVLTSQFVLKVAAKENLDQANFKRYMKSLERMRAKQKYGELAAVVQKETRNPLIACAAWRQIFKLSDRQKRNYARDRIITPILHDLGWRVQFPYSYSDKYVTVFV